MPLLIQGHHIVLGIGYDFLVHCPIESSGTSQGLNICQGLVDIGRGRPYVAQWLEMALSDFHFSCVSTCYADVDP
jgi:hypothetical protein